MESQRPSPTGTSASSGSPHPVSPAARGSTPSKDHEVCTSTVAGHKAGNYISGAWRRKPQAPLPACTLTCLAGMDLVLHSAELCDFPFRDLPPAVESWLMSSLCSTALLPSAAHTIARLSTHRARALRAQGWVLAVFTALSHTGAALCYKHAPADALRLFAVQKVPYTINKSCWLNCCRSHRHWYFCLSEVTPWGSSSSTSVFIPVCDFQGAGVTAHFSLLPSFQECRKTQIGRVCQFTSSA